MRTLFISLFLFPFVANATPTPEKPLAPQVPAWEVLQVRLDVRNLVTQDNVGALSDRELSSIIEKANRFWSQCSIQFTPRSIDNVNVLPLDIPFEPKNQGDLSIIAQTLNPNGYKGAIPFTVAGRWQLNEGGFVTYGLGWVFLDQTQVNRIGAMIDAKRLKEEWVGQLAAHELGHALSLAHVNEVSNVMAGGPILTREQCEQARSFSQGALASFLEKRPVRASLPVSNGTI